MSAQDESPTGRADPGPPTPVVYATDLTFDRTDPADLFDLAFLLRSPDHSLSEAILTGSDSGDGGERVLGALAVSASRDVPIGRGPVALVNAIRRAASPINLVVVGGYSTVLAAREADPAAFREIVARVFVVGGYANVYGAADAIRLPIDPRLRQRFPDRFRSAGDPRVDPSEHAALAALLTSGEAVIWLPRDICLWRYAAPGILEDGGRLCAFLLRELFADSLKAAGWEADRYVAAAAPVLLSSLPALLLARHPDPFVWMRLFRAITARVSTDPDSGVVTAFETATDRPNLYAVVAIDGQLLGKRLTASLRDRPLEG